jgi:hypothetical protein
MGLVNGAPNPNAAEYYYLYWVENYIDFLVDNGGPFEYDEPWVGPGEELSGENLFKLGYEDSEALAEAREKFQSWLGIK